MAVLEQFQELITIMHRLRKECPWDRKQTAHSLRQYILEEAYETIESIDNENWEELKKELGDLLLQIVFQSEIAQEKRLFSLDDVIEQINQKLIRRHPHVFGEVRVSDANDVKNNWEQIKLDEEQRQSVLDGIPRQLSALLRAQRLQDKAANVGFDWPEAAGVIAKIKEELEELEQALSEGNPEALENELGDMLFSLVNLARYHQVSAEDCLRATITKFIARFQYIERKLKEHQKSIRHSSLEEMDRLWEESKSQIK